MVTLLPFMEQLEPLIILTHQKTFSKCANLSLYYEYEFGIWVYVTVCTEIITLNNDTLKY